MDILALLVSVLLLEFLVVLSANYIQTGNAIYRWYKEFGVVAVISDVTSVLIGVMIAHFFFPKVNIITLGLLSIMVQLIHDSLFYLFVIKPLKRGENSIIDLMKDYASESSFGILIADALIMFSSVMIYSLISKQSKDKIIFLLVSSLYALTYIIYTNR
jgi:hypothetical protein